VAHRVVQDGHRFARLPGSGGTDRRCVVAGHLVTNLRNCFGRNFRMKPNLVKFNFAIMTLCIRL
jgi:hypothetical protein